MKYVRHSCDNARPNSICLSSPFLTGAHLTRLRAPRDARCSIHPGVARPMISISLQSNCNSRLHFHFSSGEQSNCTPPIGRRLEATRAQGARNPREPDSKYRGFFVGALPCARAPAPRPPPLLRAGPRLEFPFSPLVSPPLTPASSAIADRQLRVGVAAGPRDCSSRVLGSRANSTRPR